MEVGVEQKIFEKGKVGVQAGYLRKTTKEEADRYLKASYFHQFNLRLAGNVRSQALQESPGMTQLTIGTGMTLRLRRASYIFVDAERKMDEELENPWKIAAGIHLWW